MTRKSKEPSWVNPQSRPYAVRPENQTRVVAFRELPGFIRQEYMTEGRPSPEPYVRVNEWADVVSAWEGLFGRALTPKEKGDLTSLSNAQLRRLQRFIYSHQHTKPNSRKEKVFVRFSLDEQPERPPHVPSLLQVIARGRVLIAKTLSSENIDLRYYRLYGFEDDKGNSSSADNYNETAREIEKDVTIDSETRQMYLLGLMAKAALKYVNVTRAKSILLVFVNKNNIQNVRRVRLKRKSLEAIEATGSLQHSMQHYTGRDGSRRTIQSIPTSLLRQQPIPVALLPELTRPGKRIKRLPRRLPELK